MIADRVRAALGDMGMTAQEAAAAVSQVYSSGDTGSMRDILRREE